MNVVQAIQQRYSSRSYESRPVPEDVLQELLRTATNAPSANNRQEWRFVVVTDKELIAALNKKTSGQGWWATAPVMLVCCAETDGYTMACGQPSYPIDVAIIMDHISLLATEKGLATCWLGGFNESAVKELCGIPSDGVRVVEMMTLGYPADSPREKKRMQLGSVVFRNRWGNTTGR